MSDLGNLIRNKIAEQRDASDFNEPAYPCAEFTFPGLTIRQQAVLMAMQGLLAGDPHQEYSAIVHDAIIIADAVLRRERESRE